jgi:hypothetical protein
MTFQHGKDTVFKIDGNDLSVYTNSSELARTADSHDVTTYGKRSHVKQGGLLDGTSKASGIYDTSKTTGPRAVIDPLIGTVVPLIRQPEGAGTGKAQDSVDVLVVGYTETSPVADMVTWSVDLELSDDIDTTVQA